MVRRGFTLLEVLVSISIIGALLGIAAAALRPSIDVARSLRVLAVVRSDGQITQQYAADTHHWPHYAKSQLNDAFENGGVGRPYFNQQWYWMLELHTYFGDGDIVQNPIAYSPWHPIYEMFDNGATAFDQPFAQFGAGAAIPNSITLSTALFTSDAMWSATNPVLTVSQLKAVPADAVQYPSNKVMYFESVPWHLARDEADPRFAGAVDGSWPVPVTMVDGSGRVVPGRELPAPVLNPFYPEGLFSGVLLNTRRGHQGRDF